MIVVAAAVACALTSPDARPAGQRQLRKPPEAPPILRTGTRLVQVEVVVRDKNGPVTGLTRDDFTVFDQGRRQNIAVFEAAGGSAPAQPEAVNPPVPAGSVSNRTDRAGRPVSGATVLLLDQLNTDFDNQGYARSQILKFLESAQAGDQIAIYLLGKNLTVMQDFTDDRETLAKAVRRWNPENLGLLIESEELMDATDRKAASMSNPIAQLLRNQITAQAIAKIAQHLSGMPGRKNLIWVSDTPGIQGAPLLNAANIHLYPVLVRGVGSSGVVAWMRDSSEAISIPGGGRLIPSPLPAGNEIAKQRGNAALAAANGAAAFTDSKDISAAVRTAVEDASTVYILGFYPSEESLDNKSHLVAVNVGKKGAAHGRTLDIRYRPGYFGSRFAPPPAAKTSLEDVLRNPLDASAIGLTAAANPSGDKYQVRVIVDLRDVQFRTEGGLHVADVAVSMADDASQQIRTETIRLSLTDAELAGALERGLEYHREFDRPSPVRIVAQDLATGFAGSLRLAAETKENK